MMQKSQFNLNIVMCLLLLCHAKHEKLNLIEFLIELLQSNLKNKQLVYLHKFIYNIHKVVFNNGTYTNQNVRIICNNKNNHFEF